jgi:small subunit ribosomal protein S19
MSRAKWKGPYIQTNLLSETFKIKFSSQNELHTNSRKSKIIPQFLNMNFHVHNGKIFSKIKITDEMIGYKFGEFVPTRKKFSYKKKKKK